METAQPHGGIQVVPAGATAQSTPVTWACIGWPANTPPPAPFPVPLPPGSDLIVTPAAAGAAGGEYNGAAGGEYIGAAGEVYIGPAGEEYAGTGGPVVITPRGPPNPCQAAAPAGGGGMIGV